MANEQSFLINLAFPEYGRGQLFQPHPVQQLTGKELATTASEKKGGGRSDFLLQLRGERQTLCVFSQVFEEQKNLARTADTWSIWAAIILG